MPITVSSRVRKKTQSLDPKIVETVPRKPVLVLTPEVLNNRYPVGSIVTTTLVDGRGGYEVYDLKVWHNGDLIMDTIPLHEKLELFKNGFDFSDSGEYVVTAYYDGGEVTRTFKILQFFTVGVSLIGGEHVIE